MGVKTLSAKELNLLSLDSINNIAMITMQAAPVNVLSQLMIKELSLVFSILSAKNLDAVILAGSMDRGFSAGANMHELVSQNINENRQLFAELYQLYSQIENTSFPLIAAINRFAMGGGLELALCADIRVMDDDAVMAAAGVNMGLVFGTQRLPRLIGLGAAKEIILTGRRITAAEAQAIGLAQYLSPPGQAQSQALKLAELIAQKSAFSVRGAKRLLNQACNLPLEKALELELEQLDKTLLNEDFQYRAKSFLKKAKM